LDTNTSRNLSKSAIENLCAQTITPIGPVAAICIWPKFVEHARRCLKTTNNINIATVINFPAGSESPDLSTALIEQTIGDGATEIDYVMPYKHLLDGDISAVESTLKSVRECIPTSVHLKVILETGELKTTQNITLASELAIDNGADFIKTSTGNTYGSRRRRLFVNC